MARKTRKRPREPDLAATPAKGIPTLAAGARCPVCAGALAVPEWACDRCHTGHHEDCARYFGGCALFGCREGAPPTALERSVWPRALAGLRLYLGMRRVQALNFVAFVASAVLAILLAGSAGGLVDRPSMVVAALCLVSGIAHLVLDAISGACFDLLRRKLGREQTRGFSLAPSRFGHALPASRRCAFPDGIEKAARWMGGAGLLCLLVPSLFLTGAGILYAALLAYGGAAELRGHWQEYSCFENRFIASFAPDKPGSTRSSREAA